VAAKTVPPQAKSATKVVVTKLHLSRDKRANPAHARTLASETDCSIGDCPRVRKANGRQSRLRSMARLAHGHVESFRVVGARYQRVPVSVWTANFPSGYEYMKRWHPMQRSMN